MNRPASDPYPNLPLGQAGPPDYVKPELGEVARKAAKRGARIFRVSAVSPSSMQREFFDALKGDVVKVLAMFWEEGWTQVEVCELNLKIMDAARSESMSCRIGEMDDAET